MKITVTGRKIVLCDDLPKISEAQRRAIEQTVQAAADRALFGSYIPEPSPPCGCRGMS